MALASARGTQSLLELADLADKVIKVAASELSQGNSNPMHPEVEQIRTEVADLKLLFKSMPMHQRCLAKEKNATLRLAVPKSPNYLKFINERMGHKHVTEIGGIGVMLGARLESLSDATGDSIPILLAKVAQIPPIPLCFPGNDKQDEKEAFLVENYCLTDLCVGASKAPALARVLTFQNGGSSKRKKDEPPQKKRRVSLRIARIGSPTKQLAQDREEKEDELPQKKRRVSPRTTRFGSPTKQQAFEKAAEGVVPDNTRQNTKWALHTFTSWLEERNKRIKDSAE
uniref:Uncharacterized protein n=1 Tax=Amphimedon queenslandica TaxID=400682 RepID=A0A1X7U8S4_AMPQE